MVEHKILLSVTSTNQRIRRMWSFLFLYHRRQNMFHNVKLTSSRFLGSAICFKNYKNRRFRGENGGFRGASDLTRTGDLLITSEMHYRLCYTSRAIQPDYYNGRRRKCQLLFPCLRGKAAPIPALPTPSVRRLAAKTQLLDFLSDGQKVVEGLRPLVHIPQEG